MLTADQFSWDECFWTATVQLDAWKSYLDCSGPYAKRGSSGSSSGNVSFILSAEGRDGAPPSESEIAAARWIVSYQDEIQASVLRALLPEYRRIRPRYLEFLEQHGRPGAMPELADVSAFRGLIGLSSINIHPLENSGLRYFGFEMGCTWDIEHGLGALLHGTRVVKIGGADTAILLWIAEQDAEAR